jgi:hypothetical protein
MCFGKQSSWMVSNGEWLCGPDIEVKETWKQNGKVIQDTKEDSKMKEVGSSTFPKTFNLKLENTSAKMEKN